MKRVQSIGQVRRQIQALQSPTVKSVSGPSQYGDLVWLKAQYPLIWVISHSTDEDFRAQAIRTRELWAVHQGWIIQWCDQYGFFELCDLASEDVGLYRRAMAKLPQDGSIEDTLRHLALHYAEQGLKPRIA